MAVHTAFTFFILSIASSFIHQNIGLTGLFTDENIGNVMARKLFPKILISILILGFLSLIIYKNNWTFSIIHFETNFINNILQFTVIDNGLEIDLAAYGNPLFGFHNTFHDHPDARGVGLFITKIQV